jgi:RES domain-containing protein
MNRSAYRVSPTIFATEPHDAFDGKGAALHGGRWNPPGLRVVYTSWSLSLAILELLVHFRGELLSLMDVVVSEATFPENLMEWFPREKLPSNWTDPYVPPPILVEFG